MIVAFDTETSGLNPWKGDAPFALSFAFPDLTTEYFEFAVNPFTRKVQKPNAPQLRCIKELLCDPQLAKVGHNVRFDYWMVEVNWGIKVAGPIHDTMFMAHVCNPLEQNKGLKPLAWKYLKLPNDDETLLGDAVKACRRKAKKLGWAIHKDVEADYWLPSAMGNEHAEACKEYCTLDTHRTILLYKMYMQVMQERDPQALETYNREMLYWHDVRKIEGRGVKVNLDIVRKEIAYCTATEKVKRAALEKTFGEFNKEVSDNKVRAYLFTPRKSGGLGLTPDPKRMTEKTKQPQVTRDVLEDLESDVPIVRTLMDYSRIRSARQTYYGSYQDKAVPEKNYYILHASFNQIGAVTGRFSSREPNLQNVPKRAPAGDIMQRVRKPFGPRPGFIWLHLDFKSIEPRILAEESGDRDMLSIMAGGGDIYDILVKRIEAMTGFDMITMFAWFDSPGKPGSGARAICKIVFLGWTYGEGVRKMTRVLRLSDLSIAAAIIDALKTAYNRVMPFMKKMQRSAEKHQHVVNRYGRKIPIPRPIWKDGELLEFYYKATNYLIQSTAADMMKSAMHECGLFLEGKDAYMVMTIHDELVFEVSRKLWKPATVSALSDIMKAAAEQHYRRVEFPVDANMTVEHWSTPEKVRFA